MKRKLSLLILLVVVGALIVACGGETAAEQPQGGPVTDYASLVDQLRAKGATVEVAADISHDFLSVEGQTLSVNGESVQVFEYADADAAQKDATLVSPDGTTVGTTMITWVATPHFYRAGRLLVLYIGEDASTLDLLEEVLGPQFAGG